MMVACSFPLLKKVGGSQSNGIPSPGAKIDRLFGIKSVIYGIDCTTFPCLQRCGEVRLGPVESLWSEDIVFGVNVLYGGQHE